MGHMMSVASVRDPPPWRTRISQQQPIDAVCFYSGLPAVVRPQLYKHVPVNKEHTEGGQLRHGRASWVSFCALDERGV